MDLENSRDAMEVVDDADSVNKVETPFSIDDNVKTEKSVAKMKEEDITVNMEEKVVKMEDEPFDLMEDWSTLRDWFEEEANSVKKEEMDQDDIDHYVGNVYDDDREDMSEYEQYSDHSELDHSELHHSDKVCKEEGKIGQPKGVNLTSSYDYYCSNREHLSALLGDLCIFSCLWCGFECETYFEFCHHVSEEHAAKISADILEEDAESHAKHLTLIKCYICHYMVPHDSYCIFKHLFKKHNKTDNNLKNLIGTCEAQSQSIQAKKLNNLDFASMQKCYVNIKVSKYLSHIKDKINRESVACITRKDLNSKVTHLSQVYFKGEKLPVKPTSEIGDLCLFNCYKCELKIKSFKSLISHTAKHHGLPKFGNSQLICKNIEEARYHKCRFCDKIFLCDKYLIMSHIHKAHKSNLTSYMLKIPRHKLPYQPIPLKRYPFKNMILSRTEGDLVPKESTTIDVSNLCSFKCAKCWTKYDSLKLFRFHLKSCIKNTKLQAKHVTSAIFHACKLCGVLMMCDKVPIWSHLSSVHEISTATYENISILNITSYYSSQTDIRKKLDHYVSETSKFHLVDKSLVPQVPPLDKPCNPKGSLPDNLVTSKVGNFCLFGCDKCSFQTASYGGMANHNKKSDHGPGHTKFDKKYIKEARYHKCLVCGTIIISDTSRINEHVKDRHGCMLSDYKEMFLKVNLEHNNKFKGTMDLKITGTNNSCRNQVSHQYLNLSTFQCDKCKLELASWLQMKIHLRACKKNGTFDKKYVVKFVFHECKICQKKLLCDKDIIRYHLLYSHKMTGSQYLAINNKSIESLSKPREVQNGNKTTIETFQIFPASLSKHNRGFTVPKGTLKNEEMTEHIANLCVFKCAFCLYKSKTWVDMCLHVRSAKHTTNLLVTFHRDFVLEAVYHKCYVCEKGILCDKDLIRRHINSEHKILLLEKYRQRYQQSEETKGQSKSDTETYKKSYSKLPTHLTKDMLAREPINNCLFSCDKCYSRKRNWCNFRFHKRKKHGESWFKYESKYVTKAKYYQCPICKMYILCDRTMILSHLSQHKFRRMTDFENWLEKNRKVTHT